MENNVEPVP